MQITKLLTFLSLTAAVLANPASELKRDVDVQQVDCPEGVCFNDAFYCDFEDHKCRRKGGPGPCGSGECIENKDAPAPAEPAKREVTTPGDNCFDCKLGVEKCKWSPKRRQYECMPKYSLGLQGKRGPARSCGRRLADCGRNDNCCSGRCIKNNRFQVGHMTLGSCD
ncbi:TPA_exp: hypothetical protein A8136_7238 [Trichophyton benhamiae CBS 112371]|nr:TPA_exp: hypothetical protein A8136_7238 [Trichophyton benhamiae CBS 112371]